jgi:uncharacterized linocin/CFP29 family protein
MDMLRRNSAPLSERAWTELDRAVEIAARNAMAARRVATFDGPHGWEHIATPLGTTSPCLGHGTNAVVCTPDVVLLTQIRADFTLGWPAIETFERGGPALDTEGAETAAREVALAEDRIALFGNPVGSGFLTKASPSIDLQAWTSGAAVVADLVRAVAALDEAAIPGPYEALLAPARYYALLSARQEGYPASRHLEEVVAKIHRAPAMPDGGAVFSTRGGDFILTVGGDLSTGYRFHDQEAVHLFCMETMTAQTITPHAVCILRDGAR